MAVASFDDEETPPQYQVFINYRGDEVRKTFLGFLVKAMVDAKINVFTDEIEVKGRDLNNLFKRIEESRVAVAILSERYTESSWCLDELIKINERIQEEKLVVIPVFYRLDATNCKRLNGAFGDNFRNLEINFRSEHERIHKWKEALISISHKVGLTLEGHRDESELVDSIVREVKKVLLEMSNKKIDHSNNSTYTKGESTNIISSFEPLTDELNRLPLRRPQVFVSFNKEELGNNFGNHLLWALKVSRVYALTYSNNFIGREKQRKHVLANLEKSTIALVILSKRYSESDWCLTEIVKMEELAKEGKLVVIPIFYNVNENEVKRLEGEFGIHFMNTYERFAMEPFIVESWEGSLKSITRRMGFNLASYRNEFDLVGAIVKEVTRLLAKSRRKRRKLGIGEVFFSALMALFATAFFDLLISPMLISHVANLHKVGSWLIGLSFLVVILHMILF
ncbi:unnamed protein product [Cochlearia groenlandica]